MINKIYFHKKTILLNVTPNKAFASMFGRLKMKEKTDEKIRKIEEAKNPKLKNANELNDNNSTKRKIYDSPIEAIQDIKNNVFFDFPVGVTVALNVDPRKGDQNVRGIYKMVGGATKIPKIIVFTSPANHDIAKNAGADFLGDLNTIKDISEGKIEFEKCVATVDWLSNLKKVGRILGPKGLMPSAKVGTACTPDNLENIIKELKQGSKEFKLDKNAQIMVPLGRTTFKAEGLLMNLDSFMKTLIERKPDTCKARYFLYAYICTRSKFL